MFSVYFRGVIKILLFFSIIFFIIFFVVYGFRYHKKVGFIQKNVFLQFSMWSNENSVKVNGKEYKPNSKEITLFNMDEGCYRIKTNGKKTTRCFSKNQSFEDVIVKNKGKKDIKKTDKINCYDVQNLFFEKKCIKDKCFSHDINNVFRFNNINFLHFNKKLLSCNKDFQRCHNLGKIKGDIVCGNSKGLYFFNSGFKLLKLK